MFRQMSRHARRFIERGDYDASIQIQSLFDARAPGVPHFVYTDHTHLANLVYPHFDRRTLLRASWLELEARTYHEATRVFTRSSNIDRSLIEDYGCEESRVVSVGAGANVMPGFEGVGPAVEQQPPRILFVGFDWVRKGGPELLQAFEQVAKDVPGLELEIVGCEPEVPSPGVTVVGRVARERLHAHYQRASIFCLPTKREPYGVALVEAMHFGLPIVATRVGAVPEIVTEGKTGTLVEAGTVTELAEALGKLARDPQLRVEMGRCAREKANRVFTWNAVADRILTEIEHALASPSAARNERIPMEQTER
jgi:glycosyltransferase involved in cell wall biosynthesis